MAQLGSGREFGHEYEPEPQPQNQGVRRSLEDEIAAQMAREEEEAGILGPDVHDDPSWSEESAERFDGPTDESLEQAGEVEFLQELIRQAAGEKGMDVQVFNAKDFYPSLPKYFIAPMELTAMVVHEIITVDEARNYLRDQGIDLRG